MGSATSKAAVAAAPKSVSRKYPTRAAGESLAQAVRPAPTPAATTAAEAEQPISEDKPDEIDGQNADFASRLRQMGIVQPNPTFSPSSTAGRSTNDVGGPDADMLRQIQQHQQQYGTRAPASRAAPPRNTTLAVLDARRRIQDQATAELEQSMSPAGRRQGQEFLKASTIRDVLVLRASGVDAAAIEARLHLKPGVVKRLGVPGLFEALKVTETTEAAQTASPTK